MRSRFKIKLSDRIADISCGLSGLSSGNCAVGILSHFSCSLLGATFTNGRVSHDTWGTLLPEVLEDTMKMLADCSPAIYNRYVSDVFGKFKGDRLFAYLLTDCTNRATGRRQRNAPKENFISTVNFVRFLMDNNVGYVLQSPVFLNAVHRHASAGDWSLGRVWVWYPPYAVDMGVWSTPGKARFKGKLKKPEEIEAKLAPFAGMSPGFEGTLLSKGYFEEDEYPSFKLTKELREMEIQP